MLVSNVKIYGLENSIRVAKFPMATNAESTNETLTDGIKKLAQSERGEGHDQWLTGVVVQFDLTLTVKCWTEAERYHFLDFVSSQSTMHRITKFDLNKAYIEYVDPRIVDIMKEKVYEYNNIQTQIKEHEENNAPKDDLTVLNKLSKKKYLEILYSNPCGFKLTAGMTTNYRQLKTIYYQRKNHRLPEWVSVCQWIESLPMFKELCIDG